MTRLLLPTLMAVFATTGLSAQTVLEIPARYDADLFPIPDVINDAIAADTDADGVHGHDIYMLELNEAYTISRSIVFTSPATLTAPPHDRWDANMRPPEVRVQANADGTQPSPSLFVFIRPAADVTISNIYFGGVMTNNTWMQANWLRPAAPDITIRIQDVIIDYMGWSIITNLDENISGVSYISDRVYLKNNQNTGDMNSPFYILNVGPPIDSLIVRNVTYFQSHGFFLQARVPINYYEVDHVTVANALKIPIFNEMLTNARITNNIFYNTTAAGETEIENSDKDRDGITWSIVNQDTLPGNEVGAPDSVFASMPESDRKIVVKNNVWFKTRKVLDYLGDSLRTGVFMNDRTQAMFDNDAEWPGLEETNNQNIRIEFEQTTEPPSDANFHFADDKMLEYVASVRGTAELAQYWGFENDRAQWTEFAWLVTDWPITEDLRHNVTDVTDDDGGPIGDLTWWETPRGVAIELDRPGIPKQFGLEQNYPNPFNPSTRINFELPTASEVTLEVFDVTGKRVAMLIDDQTFTAGTYQQGFDASGLPSGLYLYKMTTSSSVSQSRTMLLMK